MQNGLFKQNRESSFLTLVAYYSLHHSATVREAVYQCVKHLSAYYPTDESSVQLLIDSFICEDLIRLPYAFQALIAILKPHQNASEWEAHFTPFLHSGSQLIDDLQLKGVLPFSGNVVDISGWCFVQQRNKVNKNLSLLCQCLLHTIWGNDIQCETDFCTIQMLHLCEQNDILEWICTILLNQRVSVPHINISTHYKQNKTSFTLSKDDLSQALQNDSQLQLIRKSVVLIVNHYPHLRDILIQSLDTLSVEDLIHLIDDKMTADLSEDGLL